MNTFLRSNDQSIWLWGAFFAYVALTLTSFAFYEPWRDEADSWLVAQDMSIPQLFHHLQYMGHPPLWYLILMPFAKAGLPYVTMHAVHFAIIYSAVLVFLFRAPFPVITKIFFLFSFFMSFEYALVARNYSIAILLLFLIATWFPQRFERPFIYATLVFLLFHTNVINLGAAGLFMGEFIWETLWKREQRNGKNALAILVMLVGMGVVLYQLYPAAPDISQGFVGIANSVRPYMFIAALINALVGGSPNEQHVLFFLLLAFFIFCLFMQLLDKDKKIMIFVCMLMAWLFYLFGFKYGGFLRHHTFILIYIILGYWLSTYSTGKTLSSVNRKHFVILLTSILAYSSFLSVTRHYESIIETTSGSKAVAEFIIKNGHINDIIVADRSEYSTSILPYLREVAPGKKIWFAYKQDFGSYAPFDAAFWKRYSTKKIMQNTLSFAKQSPNKNILIVLSYPLKNPSAYGVQEVYTKKAIIRLSWNQAFHRSESFWVYALK